MPLAFMEHFLIQSEDIEATKDWYVNVLGMTVGPSPDFFRSTGCTLGVATCCT
jgi:catechol 2,3-dioxygenase-like lactoylglutathione lyase family enzyme